MTRARRIVLIALGGIIVTFVLGLTVGPKVKFWLAQRNSCAYITKLEERVRDERVERVGEGGGRLIAFIGDSWTQGVRVADPLDAYPYLATELTGDTALVDGSGGSGYTNPGPCGGAEFKTRIGALLAADPDVLVIQGGLNDAVRDRRREGISELMDIVRADEPDRVIVLGAFSPPLARGELIDEVTDIIGEEARAHGFEFVPVDGWADSYVSDRIHPDKRSRERVARELAAVLDSPAR